MRRRHLPDAKARQQAEDAQIEKDQEEVVSRHIQQVAGEGGPQRPGHKAVGGEGQAEDSPEVLQAEAVCHQWRRDGEEGAEGKAHYRGQQSAGHEIVCPRQDEIGDAGGQEGQAHDLMATKPVRENAADQAAHSVGEIKGGQDDDG